jgi:hypothetical protein
MAATPSVTIVKSFTYRGSAEEFSNTYHFDGDDPATDAEWKAIADAIIALERHVYTSSVTVVRAVGHKAGVAVHAWSYDYAAHSETTAGDLTVVSGTRMAGDDAVWVRWSTTQLTSTGKPIYLRSYFHDAHHSVTAGQQDDIYSNQVTALQDFGDAMLDFMGDDSRHRAGPNGAVAQSSLAGTYVTTRTLERRGRRPPP